MIEDPEVFKFSRSVRLLIVFGIAFFGVGLILSLILPLYIPSLNKIFLWGPVILSYLFFLRMFVNSWHERNDYIVATKDGISINTSENIKFIEYCQIDVVKENHYFDYLEISSFDNRKIKLHYELTNFNRLINIITSNIDHLTSKFANISTFSRTQQLNAILILSAILFIFITTISLLDGKIKDSIMSSMFLALTISVPFIEFNKIKINSNSIEIIYFLRKKIIYFSHIKNLSIELIQGGRGKSSIFVVLRLVDGKVIKFNNLKEGSIALYLSMKSKLQLSEHH